MGICRGVSKAVIKAEDRESQEKGEQDDMAHAVDVLVDDNSRPGAEKRDPDKKQGEQLGAHGEELQLFVQLDLSVLGSGDEAFLKEPAAGIPHVHFFC